MADEGSSPGLLCLLQVYTELYIHVQACFDRGENALFEYAFLRASSHPFGAVSAGSGMLGGS
jgi:hypothetical protein